MAGTYGVTSVVSVGTVSTQLCATNTLRRGLLIESTNTNVTIAFGFGTGNAVTTAMHNLATSTRTAIGPLQPDDTGRISIASNVPTGDLAAIALTTTANVVVTEW